MVDPNDKKLAMKSGEQNLWKKQKNQIKILESLGQPGGLRFNELKEKADVTSKTLTKHMKELTKKELIEREGKRYRTTEKGCRELTRLKNTINLGTASVKNLVPFHSEIQSEEGTFNVGGTAALETPVNPEVERVGKNLNIRVPQDALESDGTLALSWEKEKGKKE